MSIQQWPIAAVTSFLMWSTTSAWAADGGHSVGTTSTTIHDTAPPKLTTPWNNIKLPVKTGSIVTSTNNLLVVKFANADKIKIAKEFEVALQDSGAKMTSDTLEFSDDLGDPPGTWSATYSKDTKPDAYVLSVSGMKGGPVTVSINHN